MLHNKKQNIDKIKCLIEAVRKLQGSALVDPNTKHLIDNLAQLANEAEISLEELCHSNVILDIKDLIGKDDS